MLTPDPITDTPGGLGGLAVVLVVFGLVAVVADLFVYFRGASRDWARWQLVGGVIGSAAIVGGGMLLVTGGGGERGDDPDPGQSYYAGVLPDEGVRLELADGASMFIPRGAFQEGIANAVGSVLDPAEVPPGPPWTGPTIAAWDFRVNGGIAEPVEVRLPKPEGSFALVHHHDGAYQLVPFRIEGDTLVAWLDRLSVTAIKRVDFDALIEEIDRAEATVRDDPLGAVEDLLYPVAVCEGTLAGSHVEFDPAVDRLVDICVGSSESLGSSGGKLITVHNRRSFFVSVRPIEQASVEPVRAEMRLTPESGWLIGPDMEVALEVGDEDLGGRAITFDVGIDVESISTTAIGFFLQQAGILEPVMQTASYVAVHGVDEVKAEALGHLRRRMAESEEGEAEGKLADVLSDEIVENGGELLSWLLNLGGIHPPDESDGVKGLERLSVDLAMASTAGLPHGKARVYLGTGGADITADEPADDDPAPGGPAGVRCNSGVEGELSAAGELQQFTFSTTGGAAVDLFAIPNTGGLALGLELLAKGEVVAEGAEPADLPDVTAIEDLPLTWLGTYVVRVWSEQGSGSFTLQMDCGPISDAAEASPNQPDTPEPAGDESAGEVIDIAYGATEVGGAGPDGTRVYRFSGSGGEYVRIDAYPMDGTPLELGLLNANGRLLAGSGTEDEWGYVTIWDYELPATGTYYLEAYNDFGPVGRHQIWLERMEFDWPLIYELHASCADGELNSCDVLTWADMAPVGSDYEWFGLTCGGRLAQPKADIDFCYDVVPDSQQPDDGPASIRLEPVLSTGDVQVTLRWTGEDRLHLSLPDDPVGDPTAGFAWDQVGDPEESARLGLIERPPTGCMGAEPRVLNYYIGEDAPRGVYTIRYLRHDPCIRDSTPTDYELTVTLDGLSYTVTGTIGVGEHLGWRYGDDPIAQSFHRFEY